MAQRRAAITKDEFGQLFKRLFDREYDDRQPLLFLTAEERKLVEAYVIGGHVWDQLTYRDPITNQTYEVFYNFDYDAGWPVVAFALREDRTKARLTRSLRQRMQEAAYNQWLREALEDEAEERVAADCAFRC